MFKAPSRQGALFVLMSRRNGEVETSRTRSSLVTACPAGLWFASPIMVIQDFRKVAGMAHRVLVTGGSGFLGRGLAMALRRDGYEVVLGARNHEANADAKRETGCLAVPLDVARPESVRDVIGEYRPHVVVHCAASKRVQYSQLHPMECVDTNVGGSQNVARAAAEYGVSRMLAVSTDKAAGAPRSVYGTSKALMERMLCALDARGETRFACVRLGNLAWSTGSVLPEWLRMRRETGVISTTGADMYRFFISRAEAVAILVSVLERFDDLRGGVFVPAMSATRMRDLLEAFVDEHGGRCERAPPRPGDSPGETLLAAGEVAHAKATEHGWVLHFDGEARTTPGKALTTDTAPRLTRPELRSLVRGAGSPLAAPS